MSFSDLPVEWIVGGSITLLLIIFMVRASRSRDSHRRRSYTPIDDGAAQTPDHRILAQAASEMRGAIERHAEQMEALRTFWSQRLDAVEEKLDLLSRSAKQTAPPARDDARAAAAYAAAPSAGSYNEDSARLAAIPTAPSW